MSATVTIDELRLLVPGLSSTAAAELGHEVAQLVAAGLPPSVTPRRLGALDLRVRIAAGTPRSRLATIIASAILEQL
jgi:hypothetical protein